MAGNIGSGVRRQELRSDANPDPIHDGRFIPLGPVDGRGGTNICGPYEPVLGWPEPLDPEHWRTGSGRSVYAESPDRIVTVYGGEVPALSKPGVWGEKIFRDLRFTNGTKEGRHQHEILVYNRAGEVIEIWDQWLDEFHKQDVADGRTPNLGHINRLRVNRYDPEGHIWIVGTRNTGIFKFTRDGKKLLLKINAENVPEELHPLYYVQDLAFLPNGDLIVNHWCSVMRFSSEGEFLSAFGRPGKGQGEFDGLHGVEVHPETLNLYLNDRMNNRIQIMDPEGRFIQEWQGFQGIYTIRLTKDGSHLWVSNGFVHKFLKYDMDGRLVPLATWGTFGIAPGAMWAPHYFDTDSEGNLYIAEDYFGRVQKLTPLEGVDPSNPQLIGQLSR